MSLIDFINDLDESLKYSVDDVIHVFKTLITDVDQLQKDVKKLKRKSKYQYTKQFDRSHH